MLKLKAIPVKEGNEQIDGVHLMWNPVLHGQFPLTGYTLWRRKSITNSKKPVCRLIDGTAMEALHSNYHLIFSGPDIVFNQLLFSPIPAEMDAWKQKIKELFLSDFSSSSVDFQVYSYEANFTHPVYNVQIEIAIKPPFRFVMAIGYRDECVVASKVQKTSLKFSFDEPVDKVRFYILAKAETIRVCYRTPDYGKAEDWELLIKDLCLPFKGFTAGVSTTEDEFKLFKDRIKEDEVPEFKQFEKISGLIRASRQFANSNLLPSTSVMEYLKTENGATATDVNLNAAPFAMLLTFSVFHNYRMGFGFGYLDQHDLEPNRSYDYKITAKYHKNVIEKIYDFHTVPLKTRIDPCFSLAGIFFFVNQRTTVDGFPGPSTSATENPFIKGIRINGHLRIVFPELTKCFALYCVEDTNASVRIGTSLIPIAVKNRTEIILETPSNSVEINGDFVLAGIAYPSLSEGTDPYEKIEIASYCFGIPYVNTARPEPPTFLAIANTQMAWIPLEKKAPEGLGFILSWQQPATSAEAIDPAMWPPDSPSPPLPELGYYKLEYRNVSPAASTDWVYYDAQSDEFPNGIVVHTDGASSSPVPLQYGSDLLTVFPVGNPISGDYALIQRIKHLLSDLKGTSIAMPGTMYQYRIWSVDLIGRSSISARKSLEVRLEKRQPPPAPAGLDENQVRSNGDMGYVLPDPRTDLRPQHVYVRVLQSNNTALTISERTLLGTRDHLTILTWTWGEEERKLDPFAKEFRIYFRQHEHGTIKGECTEEAEMNGSTWKIEANLSVPVNINEFAGHNIILNRVPFKIVTHQAGTNIEIVISPPLTSPGKIPKPGSFELYRKSAGEEARPLSWDNRIAVIPLRQHEVYQYVLETGIILSDPETTVGLTDISYDITPEGQNTRCWLGVSAADTESYIIDQLAAVGIYSPRPGNEGAIVTAVVSAKYAGRPVFTPPPPLNDVPVLILDEVSSEELLFNFTPIDWMPFLDPQNRLRIERITGTDLISLLHVENDSIQIADAENPDIVTDWLLDPGDEIELRAAFRSSYEPIPAKFIWAMSKRNDIHLDVVWRQVNPEPILSTESVTDLLPNRAERYIYRARLVNAIGIPSERAAFFPNVWRAPDKTIPAGVIVSAIKTIAENTDSIIVSPVISMDASVAGGVKGILVFAAAFPSVENVNDEQLNRASLLKIPNRPDFLSEQMYKIRAANQQIEPIFISISSAEKEINADAVTLVWNTIEFNFPYNAQAVLWAASVSNDHVLSPLSAFKKIFTGLMPPVLPDAQLETGATGIQISFNAESVDGFFYRIERSDENAENGFNPVTPWFKTTIGLNTRQFVTPQVTSWFRIKIRNVNNKEYTGAPTIYNS